MGLDVCRARTFVGEAGGNPPTKTKVPVVGGHAGTTIVPLLSQAEPAVTFDDATRDALTKRIMFGGDEVVEAKAGGGSATLSMAYSGAEFFASKVTLGKEGVDTIHDLGTINDHEKKLIADMMPDLLAQAEKGVKFVNGQ